MSVCASRHLDASKRYVQQPKEAMERYLRSVRVPCRKFTLTSGFTLVRSGIETHRYHGRVRGRVARDNIRQIVAQLGPYGEGKKETA